MDALSTKACIAAFNAMGGVDVHIILPLPKYIRNGELLGSLREDRHIRGEYSSKNRQT
jgi:hypothetical protein